MILEKEVQGKSAHIDYKKEINLMSSDQFDRFTAKIIDTMDSRIKEHLSSTVQGRIIKAYNGGNLWYVVILGKEEIYKTTSAKVARAFLSLLNKLMDKKLVVVDVYESTDPYYFRKHSLKETSTLK
jgi:hypothetical protein